MSLLLDIRAPSQTAQTRIAILLCASAAIALGALATVGSTAWLSTVLVLLLLITVAWTMPVTWGVVALGALLPWQIYLPLFDSAFTLRGASVLAWALALRIAWSSKWRAWMLPVAFFLCAALVGAMGASSRYLAFKGIYDWLSVFAALFVTSQIIVTRFWAKRVILVVIAGGVAEAALGLLEHGLGLARVVEMLHQPASHFLYSPSLLAERLVNLTFNWVTGGQALPFGTFINAVDYAVYLAAILVIVIGWLWQRGLAAIKSRQGTVAALAATLLLGSTLLLTFKASGLIALAGGMGALLLLSARRSLSDRMVLGLLAVIGTAILALPLAGPLTDRVAFLMQREQGTLAATGRLEIWAQLFQSFSARPFFGYGLNNAGFLTEPLRTLNGGAFGLVPTAPESGYVAALVETGAIGFVALVALFLWTVVRGYSRLGLGERPALVAATLAALVALWAGNLTVTGFTTDQNGMLMGLLMGIVWSEWNPR